MVDYAAFSAVKRGGSKFEKEKIMRIITERENQPKSQTDPYIIAACP